MFLKIICPFATETTIDLAKKIQHAQVETDFVNVNPDTGEKAFILSLKTTRPPEDCKAILDLLIQQDAERRKEMERKYLGNSAE